MPSVRQKTISTSAIRSRRLARISSDAERLYWRLQLSTDAYGCSSGDPWDVMQDTGLALTGWTEKKTTKALSELAQIGLIHTWMDEGQKRPFLHIDGHDKHQSDSYRARRGRRTTPEPPANGQLKSSPANSRVVASTLTPKMEMEMEMEVEEERRTLSSNVTADAAVTRPPNTEVIPSELVPDMSPAVPPVKATGGFPPTLKARKGKHVTANEKVAAVMVYQEWVTLAGKKAGAVKFTKERAEYVIDRLRDGFTVADLVAAMKFWLADPHHAGQNDRGAVYDDLVTLVRSENKVQKALESTQHASNGKNSFPAEALAEARRLAEQRAGSTLPTAPKGIAR